MASEIRHIIFNNAELLRALTVFRRRISKPIPPGTVKKMTVEEASGVRVGIALESAKNGSNLSISFDAQEIGAALVMFCIHNNIPIPASGFTKELTLTDRMVTMTVRSSLPTELADTP